MGSPTACRLHSSTGEWVLNDRQFQFEWDEIKAAANVRKHGISFDLARTVFHDPRVL
jgi:hypothetical protein